MQRNIVRILENFKPFLMVLCVALIGASTLSAGALALTQAGAPQKTGLESSAEAKRALALIEPRDFAKIKDSRKRAAALRSYNALKAIATNTSKAREATLMANFDRTILALKALPPPKSASFQACDEGYKRCMDLCKETPDGCGHCQLVNNTCYQNEWCAAYERENDNDPTNN